MLLEYFTQTFFLIAISQIIIGLFKKRVLYLSPTGGSYGFSGNAAVLIGSMGLITLVLMLGYYMANMSSKNIFCSSWQPSYSFSYSFMDI